MVTINTPSMEQKRINRNRIYRFISQQGTTSKNEIAQVLRISLPTVTQHIANLMEQKLIHEVGEYESTGGRPAKMLACNAMAKVAVGINITRNHFSAVLTNLLGEVVDSIRESFDCSDPLAPISKFEEVIDYILKKNCIKDEAVLGVGISLPAIIASDNKTIHTALVIPYSRNYYEQLRPHIRFPFFFYNDANCGGFAELCVRKPIERDMFYVSLSGTVGGAVLINDKIYAGRTFASGEIGHTVLVPNGRQCYCGRKGCVDTYCSSNILAELTDGNLSAFFEKLSTSDPQAVERMNTYVDHLAIAIHNVRMLFDCDIILGGYVGSYSHLFLDDLKKKLAETDLFEREVDYITGCYYHTEAAAVGAALMFTSQFIDNI